MIVLCIFHTYSRVNLMLIFRRNVTLEKGYSLCILLPETQYLMIQMVPASTYNLLFTKGILGSHNSSIVVPIAKLNVSF